MTLLSGDKDSTRGVPGLRLLVAGLLLAIGCTGALAAPPARDGLRIDGTAFVDASGRPVALLADTAWRLMFGASDADVDFYLDVRRAQGFNAVFFMLLQRPHDRLAANGVHPLSLDADKKLVPGSSINPDYLAFVRKRIEAMNARGMTALVLPTWGTNVTAGLFDAAAAERYGRDIARAIGDLDVVWLIGGDVNPKPADIPVWNAMAAGIRSGERVRRPMSYHPTLGSSATWFGEADWHDFTAIQSGHSRSRPPERGISAVILAEWTRDRLRPVIDLESGYEDVPDGLGGNHPERKPVEKKDRFQASDIRLRAYQQALSGSAGYVYGFLDLARFWRPGDPPRWPPNVDWREALFYPGANQMQHLLRFRALFDDAPLVPAPDLIDAGPAESDDTRMLAGCAPDRSRCAVYTPAGAPVRLGASVPREDIGHAMWMSPVTGAFHPASLAVDGDRLAARPPDAHDSDGARDWLLILSLGPVD